ncbi:MAG: CotH kinase family protein, partial [Planctomycetota bacterium]
SLKIDISRPGFTLEGQRFGGKKKLSIESGDGKAFVTEGLSWNIYNMAGVVSGRANWIKIYISTNGGASFDYKGLFANVVQVDEEYLEDHMPGRHDYGFLWKRHELGGDYLKTRWPETDPFQFNWYPFDHMGGGSEVPTPADWLVQAEERVNMDQLLKFAAAENFIQNTDGTINKGNNFWYYDWANGPDPNIMDPSYAQPRMYFPWDLDTTMDPLVPPTLPIINDLNGNMVEGLILEEDEGGTPYGYPTFQADYYGKYAGIVNGPLTKPNLLALITTIESAIATEIDADPFLGGPGTAAAEFARLRTYVQDRWDFVASELAAVTFDLTTSVVNDGSVIVNPDRIQFGDGEIAELTAVANSGVFLRWEGDVTSTDNPLLLTMDSDKSVTAVFSASGTDITPPTPAPTFAVAPYATGSTSIAMASTIAVDPNGVEYYFTCISGGGNDSGWISENSYEDAGLTPGGTYTYTVKARDLSVNYNQTAQSAGSGATTMSGLIPAVDDLVDRETAIDGTVSGTYLDVQASDDVYESITEREQLGGPPNSKYSYLEHEWEIDVTGSDPLTLFVEAYGTDTSAEGDTYSFTYSVDGGSNYFAIGTVGATESVISVALPAMGGTGTVIVKVVDDDHTASNRTLDTLYVDEIYVNFPGGGTIPGQDVIISPADIATDVGVDDDLSWTPGADSTGTQVYFGTDPTPDATEYQGNFAGATFDPGTLLEDTTYYVRLDAVNAYDITKGTVTSFTTQTLDVTVPNVVGQAQATAEGNIVAAGLTVGTVSSVCDASPAG